jgi:hypothetical protein
LFYANIDYIELVIYCIVPVEHFKMNFSDMLYDNSDVFDSLEKVQEYIELKIRVAELEKEIEFEIVNFPDKYQDGIVKKLEELGYDCQFKLGYAQIWKKQ